MFPEMVCRRIHYLTFPRTEMKLTSIHQVRVSHQSQALMYVHLFISSLTQPSSTESGSSLLWNFHTSLRQLGFLKLSHALRPRLRRHRVPWPICCSLTPDQLSHSSECLHILCSLSFAGSRRPCCPPHPSPDLIQWVLFFLTWSLHTQTMSRWLGLLFFISCA